LPADGISAAGRDNEDFGTSSFYGLRSTRARMYHLSWGAVYQLQAPNDDLRTYILQNVDRFNAQDHHNARDKNKPVATLVSSSARSYVMCVPKCLLCFFYERISL
jgi:hypothetical protein